MNRTAVTSTLASPMIGIGGASERDGSEGPGPEVTSLQDVSPLRVFVADRHPLVLRALRQVISDQPDLRLVGEACTEQALFLSESLAASDVLVVDSSLGTSLVEGARARFPGLVIVAHSILPRDPFEAAALRAGASAFVAKGEHPAALLEAIRHRPGRGNESIENLEPQGKRP